VRGGVGVLNQLCITIGILIAYAVGLAFSVPAALATDGWRLSLGFGVLFSVAHAAGTLLYVKHDSPKWLLARGNAERAHAALVFMLGTADAHLADVEIGLIRDDLAGSGPSAEALAYESGDGGDGVLHTSHLFTVSVIIASLLSMFQQGCGINAVIY
jgi:hypothetical protein